MFSAINGDLPTREIYALELFGAVASDAEVEREIGATCNFRTVIMDRAQPAERTLHEADRRHKHTQRTDIKRL